MNLSIKNVPETLVERLRRRATANHRSLQGELMSVLEQTVSSDRLSIDEARSRLLELRFQTDDQATVMIREDRDAR